MVEGILVLSSHRSDSIFVTCRNIETPKLPVVALKELRDGPRIRLRGEAGSLFSCDVGPTQLGYHVLP